MKRRGAEAYVGADRTIRQRAGIWILGIVVHAHHPTNNLGRAVQCGLAWHARLIPAPSASGAGLVFQPSPLCARCRPAIEGWLLCHAPKKL